MNHQHLTIASSPSPVDAMAAIQAVLDLHSPEYSDLERKDHPYCPVCEFDNMNLDWPCPTVKAITGALGGARTMTSDPASVLQAPLSLKDLEVAWEAAEQADECRKGDVLIIPGGWGGYTIWEAERGTQLRVARILSRAPRERGVRVAGGDGDE